MAYAQPRFRNSSLPIDRACRELYKLVPAKDPTRSKVYSSCALVGNSGVMLVAKQGKAIDAHDMVFRFNGAPTKGLEEYVGSRTDFRLVNSKVRSRPLS